MNIFSRLLRSITGPPARAAGDRVAQVRARYDAAQTTEENYRHWVEADILSSRAANSHEVRRKLRMRSRYEAANNSYASGIVETLADDLIGTGPRLQLLTADKASNRSIEAAWCEWSEAINLTEKLRTMRQARAVDGEAFAVMVDNPKLPTPVHLDIRTFEADQFHTPFPYPINPLWVDGIVFDEHMNPAEYHLLRAHPGDDLRWAYGFEFDAIPAEYVIHWFRPRRPQEYRAVPELTPGLTLFAMLRRYTLAVLRAAETAADFAAMLETTQPPDDDTQRGDPFESLQIERGMMTTLPEGYHMNQLRAEQPTTAHDAFTRAILTEIARGLKIPYPLAAGNWQGLNYSSGRLVHQTYYRGLDVEQTQLGCRHLTRIFKAWLAEASMAMPGLVPGGTRVLMAATPGPKLRWLWPGFEHVDPEKEANAQETRLRNGMTTFTEECYRDGVDPDDRQQWMEDDAKRFEKSIFRPAWMQPALPKPAKPQPQDNGGGDNADQGNQGDGQGGDGAANGHLVHRNGRL